MKPFLCFLGLTIILMGILNTIEDDGIFYLSKMLVGLAIVIISFNLNKANVHHDVQDKDRTAECNVQ